MRIAAVTVKEFWGLVRQPQLLVLLLVGPVLLMVAFGLSLDLRSILLPRAVVVVEPGSEGAELFSRFRETFVGRTTFAGTTDDPEEARERLEAGEVDAVIAVPPDPLEVIAAGEQAVLRVTYSTINPVFGSAVPRRTYGLVLDLNQSLVQAVIESERENLRAARGEVDELNDRLAQANVAAEAVASEEAQRTTADLDETLAGLEEALEVLEESPGRTGEDASGSLERVRAAREDLARVREAQERGEGEILERSGVADLQESLAAVQGSLAGLPADVPAAVLANPFRSELENLSSPPDAVGFYAPGVLALLIQHISVSLASLSVVRERLGGSYEFFGVSPLGLGELLAGKFATYFGLVLGVNLTVAAALAGLLGIPVEGGGVRLGLAMALLTVASLGVGFLVSALARSQLQAVQVSMLLLIGSAFFSGFLFPLDDMNQPAGAISLLLPATYGIRSLQDVMIRGQGISGADLGGLLVIATLCLALARILMARKTP